MTHGELADAKRRALGLLDKWLGATGVVTVGASYYYELQSLIEDAVECGAQGATGDFKLLDGEETASAVAGWRERPPRQEIERQSGSATGDV